MRGDVEIEVSGAAAPTWAPGASESGPAAPTRVPGASESGPAAPTRVPGVSESRRGEVTGDLRWQAVDRALRTIAQRRAGLDAEEVRWLREAEALQIWRPLGMVSALDYMERVLGYAPRTARDRLRVARALGALPRMTEALAHGALPFSAVRELTRVATAATERAWVEAAAGKNLRQIEELVADHHPGDAPDDPKDPTARMHVVGFELSADTYALLRQARQLLDDEHGTSLSEDQLVAGLCNAVLDGAPAGEPTGRAKFQVALVVCERCQRGWQEGAGARVAVSAAAVERAMCDAQHLGSLDGAAPERAYQDIPPSVVRFVWRRDGGRCRVPGCRSSRGLELHHILHRADGGGHDASNLVLACFRCHQSHHAGALTISGTAEHLEVQRRTPPATVGEASSARVGVTPSAHVGTTPSAVVGVVPDANDTAYDPPPARTTIERSAIDAHVGASKLDLAVLQTHARAALKQLGWTPAIAQAAVTAAAATVGPHATLQQLIVEALRRCPLRVATTRPPEAPARSG